MFNNKSELFTKEDLNVRVSVLGKNPRYCTPEIYKDAWIKRICEALDESESDIIASCDKYSVFCRNKEESYIFKDCNNYTTKLFDKDNMIYSLTFSNVKAQELISFIQKAFIPKTIRIDSDYCSWVILILDY